MRKTYLVAAVAGVAAAGMILPRVVPKARLALRRAVTLPYVSGVPGVGPAGADPARGRPA